MDIYVTSQGDTWDSIAYDLFGSEGYMGILMDANLDDEWAWLRHDESETDDRSILEVYREEGYTDACYIAASIYDEDDEEETEDYE